MPRLNRDAAKVVVFPDSKTSAGIPDRGVQVEEGHSLGRTIAGVKHQCFPIQTQRAWTLIDRYGFRETRHPQGTVGVRRECLTIRPGDDDPVAARPAESSSEGRGFD